jgi:hypothetical protein
MIFVGTGHSRGGDGTDRLEAPARLTERVYAHHRLVAAPRPI